MAGSVPAAASAQVPSLPATLQASQGPVQAPSQQTPSVQKPEAHWLAELQAWPPLRELTQVPALQKRPALQSASATHGAAHAATPTAHQLPPHSDAGSVPPGMGVHPPSSPRRLQASQVPSHARLQHRPSTQKPEAQSAPSAQTAPLAFAPLHASAAPQLPAAEQPPFTQSPDAHSAPEAHPLPLGSLPTQVPALQLPPTSHSAALVQARSQLPAPVQKATPQSLPGSVPAPETVQVPPVPGALHASHGPVQAASQQTPSVQKPEPHSAALPHATPSPVRTMQLPRSQRKPTLQSALDAHVASHVVDPEQSPAPHSCAGSFPSATGEQVPAVATALQASQVPLHAPSQQTPSAQKPEAQSAPEAHARAPPRFGVHVPDRQLLPPSHSASVRQPVPQRPAPSQV